MQTCPELSSENDADLPPVQHHRRLHLRYFDLSQPTDSDLISLIEKVLLEILEPVAKSLEK